MTLELHPTVDVETTWVAVCRLKALTPERGAAALVAGVQIALFRTHDDRVHAVQQLDPFSGAHVISRGIVGSRGDAPTVASPMYRQVFDLRTGKCLDPVGKPLMHLRTYGVRLDGDVVSVRVAPDADADAGTEVDGGWGGS